MKNVLMEVLSREFLPACVGLRVRELTITDNLAQSGQQFETRTQEDVSSSTELYENSNRCAICEILEFPVSADRHSASLGLNLKNVLSFCKRS